MARTTKHDEQIFNTIGELASFTGFEPSELLEIFNAQSEANQRNLAAQVHGDTPAQFRDEAAKAAKSEQPADGDDKLLDDLLGGAAA